MIIEKKEIQALDEETKDRLGVATITAKAKYSVNITKSKKKKNCFILHYNAADGFLYANSVKIQQFKAKGSEIKPYPLCLGNISKKWG